MSDLRPAHVTHGMSVVAGCENPQVTSTLGGSQLETSEAHPVRQHHVGGPLTPDAPEAALNRILPDAQDSSPTARPAKTRGTDIPRSGEVAQPVTAMLQEFHTRPGVDCQQPDQPTLDVPGALQRLGFIEEEVRELREAIETGDLIAAADALADITYAVYGTAWRFRLDLDALVAEVHRSNMTKTPSPGDGKAIKGPGYSRPDIARVISEAVTRG